MIEDFRNHLREIRKEADKVILEAKKVEGFFEENRISEWEWGRLQFEVGRFLPEVPDWIFKHLRILTIDKFCQDLVRTWFNNIFINWKKIYKWIDDIFITEYGGVPYITIILTKPYDEYLGGAYRLQLELEFFERLLEELKKERDRGKIKPEEIRDWKIKLESGIDAIKWWMDTVKDISEEVRLILKDFEQIQKESLDLKKEIEETLESDEFWKKEIERRQI